MYMVLSNAFCFVFNVLIQGRYNTQPRVAKAISFRALHRLSHPLMGYDSMAALEPKARRQRQTSVEWVSEEEKRYFWSCADFFIMHRMAGTLSHKTMTVVGGCFIETLEIFYLLYLVGLFSHVKYMLWSMNLEMKVFPAVCVVCFALA